MLYHHICVFFQYLLMASAHKRTGTSYQTEIDKWGEELIQKNASSVFNGCILHLYFKLKTRVKAHEQLSQLVGYQVDKSKFCSHLRSIESLFKKLKQHAENENNWKQLQSVLKLEWEIVAQRETIPPKSHPAPIPAKKLKAPMKLRNDCEKCPTLKLKIETLEKSVNKLKDDVANKSLKSKADDLNLKQLNASIKQMEKAHQQEVKSLQKDLDYQRTKLLVMTGEKSKMSVECSKWKEKVKKRDSTLKRVRAAKNNLCQKLKLKYRRPDELAKSLRDERLKVTWREKKIKVLEGNIVDLERDLRSVRREIKNLHLFIDDLECTANDEEPTANGEQTDRVRQYDPNVRRVMYEALHSKVSALV